MKWLGLSFWNVFVAKINSSGYWISSFSAGTPNGDNIESLFINSSGDIYTSGTSGPTLMNFGSTAKINPNNLDDWYIAKISRDYDFDSIPDSIDDDDDGDLILDVYDDCDFSPFGFQSIG